jgi:methionine-rich copper-binding protein CopC
MRLSLSLIPMAILAGGLSRAAFAHAEMINAVPRVGSTVTAAPTEIAINYTQGVKPELSTIEVQDASGTRVDTGDVRLAADNDKRMTVGLKPLKAGTYKVIRHATSTTTHKTQGSYSFAVSPAQ